MVSISGTCFGVRDPSPSTSMFSDVYKHHGKRRPRRDFQGDLSPPRSRFVPGMIVETKTQVSAARCSGESCCSRSYRGKPVCVQREMGFNAFCQFSFAFISEKKKLDS